MRLDRLITLGLVHPFRRVTARLAPSGQTRGAELPVLMYHSISEDRENGVGPYYRVCTSPGRFAAHLQWLADWGYRGVTLTAGLAALRAPGPGRLVALTFDDGFRDFHTAAFPLLQRHGFTATMYLPTAFIGTGRQTFKGRECLTWEEVRELHRAGVEFGSHTVSHPELVRVAQTQLETELRDSKRAIERELSAPVRSFAYPYAFPSADRPFVARLHEALRQAGYASCVTTEIGPARAGDDALQLRRLPANEADDGALLRAKLDGDYEWLRGAQRMVKRAKTLRHNPTATRASRT